METLSESTVPNRPPELSVVVPVRDEAGNVAPLLREIAQALESVVDYEIIYVDDGSRDATLAELEAERAHAPRLRVLRHRRGCGQSTALLTGVRAAHAPWVATLDGDGQNDPADIPRLLRILADPSRPADLQLIIGHRVHRRDSALRRLSSRVANGVRRRLLRDATPDAGCGLKLFPREVFLALPYFDHMHRFLPALVRRAGGTVMSVPVGHRARRYGRSHYGVHNRLWAGLVDLLGVVWLTRRAHRPEVEEVVPERSTVGVL
jgi:dolichol-phosphate mannosyltransferase